MSVCYNCPKRELRCKSTCPEWQKEREEYNERKHAFIKSSIVPCYQKKIVNGIYDRKRKRNK